MRERQTQMSFRVFPTERKTITAKAKQFGMNTSEYLRTCALNKELKAPPSPELLTDPKYFTQVKKAIQPVKDYFRNLEEKGCDN